MCELSTAQTNIGMAISLVIFFVVAHLVNQSLLRRVRRKNPHDLRQRNQGGAGAITVAILVGVFAMGFFLTQYRQILCSA